MIHILRVTRNGRPAAVLLSPDDLESMEETVEILQDRSLMESIPSVAPEGR